MTYDEFYKNTPERWRLTREEYVALHAQMAAEKASKGVKPVLETVCAGVGTVVAMPFILLAALIP
jgi:lipopolysaccharide/colanic/teichoic acid biosynthesis glycosyltransferase